MIFLKSMNSSEDRPSFSSSSLLIFSNSSLSVYFNFQTRKTSDIISVKNITNSSDYIIYFSADTIYSRFSTFNLTFIDLKPYTYYSIKLTGCNNFGCATASGNFDKDKERTQLITGDQNKNKFKSLLLKDFSVFFIWLLNFKFLSIGEIYIVGTGHWSLMNTLIVFSISL